MKQNCDNCKYWKKKTEYCYRFPKEEVKFKEDWCGEWKKRK